jgi:hypothetical protein
LERFATKLEAMIHIRVSVRLLDIRFNDFNVPANFVHWADLA